MSDEKNKKKKEKEESFSNKARTLLGLNPLPEPKIIDAGFVASRIAKGYK